MRAVSERCECEVGSPRDGRPESISCESMKDQRKSLLRKGKRF
jgi:hypothetical protein